MSDIKDRMEGAARTVKGMAEKGVDQTLMTTQSAGDWAKEVASDAVGVVKEKVHDAAAGASELADRATDKAQEWASAVSDAAAHAKDDAQHMATATVEKVEDLAKEMTALIRRYPLQALLVGIGAGFLLGELLHRSPAKRA